MIVRDPLAVHGNSNSNWIQSSSTAVTLNVAPRSKSRCPSPLPFIAKWTRALRNMLPNLPVWGSLPSHLAWILILPFSFWPAPPPSGLLPRWRAPGAAVGNGHAFSETDTLFRSLVHVQMLPRRCLARFEANIVSSFYLEMSHFMSSARVSKHERLKCKLTIEATKAIMNAVRTLPKGIRSLFLKNNNKQHDHQDRKSECVLTV